MINTPIAAFVRDVAGGQHSTLCVCLVVGQPGVAWGVTHHVGCKRQGCAWGGTFHRGCAACALTGRWQGSLVDTAARARVPGMARWGDPEQMEAGPASWCNRTDWWMPVTRVMTSIVYTCHPPYFHSVGEDVALMQMVASVALAYVCLGVLDGCAEASEVISRELSLIAGIGRPPCGGFHMSHMIRANWQWQLACLGYTLHKPSCAHTDACILDWYCCLGCTTHTSIRLVQAASVSATLARLCVSFTYTCYFVPVPACMQHCRRLELHAPWVFPPAPSRHMSRRCHGTCQLVRATQASRFNDSLLTLL